MKIFKKLGLMVGDENKIIYFGIPDSDDEIEEMHKLRYSIYSQKKYIEERDHALDIDEYDDGNRSTYFIAKLDNKIIGTVRLIIDDILPTEKAFAFENPKELLKLGKNNRCELGRLIIRPYNKEKNLYLPRNIILLFLIYCIVLHSEDKNIYYGYSFVKESLLKKMKKLKIPITEIENFKQIYPEGAILHKYFMQNHDKVVPIYFLTDNVKSYITKVVHRKKLFKKINQDTFILNDSLYNKFLRRIKIL